MKVKIVRLVVVFFIGMSIVSCNTKENYLNSFESFVEDVEINGEGYSKEDWEYCDEEYEAYVGDYMDRYSDQLTKEDYQQIGRLKARYHKAMIAHVAIQIGDAIDASSQMVAGYLEEMGSEEGLENFVNSLSDAIDGRDDEFDEIFE